MRKGAVGEYCSANVVAKGIKKGLKLSTLEHVLLPKLILKCVSDRSKSEDLKGGTPLQKTPILKIRIYSMPVPVKIAF